MTHRHVVAGGIEFDFAPDDRPPVATRHWALATAQLVDEIAGEPIGVPFRLTLETQQVAARPGPDGTFALVAVPWRRVPPLAGPPIPPVRVHVVAEGYLPRIVDFAIPFDLRSVAAPALVAGNSVATLSSAAGLSSGQTIVFDAGSSEEFATIATLGPGANDITLADPLTFAHAVGADVAPATPAAVRIALHRAPVRLLGRVVRIGAAGIPTTPVANASVTIADLWRTALDVRTRPTSNGVPVGTMTVATALLPPLPFQPAFPVALLQGLVANRPTASTADQTDLAPVVADDTGLMRRADEGSVDITVAEARAFAAGDVLRVDAGDREASELHTINTIAPVGTPLEPAAVGLDFPLQHSRAPGARIDHLNPPVIPPPLGPLPFAVVDEGAAGDRTLFLDALPRPPFRPGVRVVSAGMADEYHDFSIYRATSDSDGYFRLPAIHRVAEVRLDVDDNGVVTTFFVNPEYGDYEHWLDLRLQ